MTHASPDINTRTIQLLLYWIGLDRKTSLPVRLRRRWRRRDWHLDREHEQHLAPVQASGARREAHELVESSAPIGAHRRRLERNGYRLAASLCLLAAREHETTTLML